MIGCNKLRGLVAIAAVLLVLPPEALEAHNRKGDKLVALAREAEAQKEYDKALDYYQQALRLDPQEPAYQLGVRRLRFQAGQAHVEAGIKLRNSNQIEEALVEFQKAYGVDAGSTI